MTIIRTRIIDLHGLPFLQENIDFAIPFLDKDTPAYVRLFLLWKINSQQENSLYSSIVNLLHQYLTGNFSENRILCTRNKVLKNIFPKIINLWSGQGKCNLVLEDDDLKLMG